MSHRSLRDIRHVVLDLDGTVFLDDRVFPETRPFLSALREMGIGYSFITNRSSHSTTEHETKLRGMGIDVRPGDVYTASRATIDFLRSRHPSIESLFALGTPNLHAELRDAGFRLTGVDRADEPNAVVIGFDTTLTYERLCCAAYWIAQGKPYLATHPDFTCPTSEPTVLVDCGAVCAALELATGRRPDAVLGKPRREIIEALLRRLGLTPDRVAMAGDRLYTDMKMARETGLLAILVLTGETTREQSEDHRADVDLVVDHLGVLENALRAARPAGCPRAAD